MIQRARKRATTRDLWKIGTPFDETAREAVEAKIGGGGGGFPPFKGRTKTKWNDASLSNEIAKAVVRSLQEAGQIPSSTSHEGGDRGGGWLRFYLRGNGADEKASELFAEAMQQVLGPLENPRYMIPRYVADMRETWLSRTMPGFIGKFFRQKTTRIAMYHSVPKCLAKTVDLAKIFEGYWNEYVSPGVIIYGRGATGKQAVHGVIARGLSPQVHFHRKKVFGSK